MRDDQETLGRVLSQAATFCDELVVVDTGSTDGSREIAVAAGARVIDYTWTDDFAAARNVSFDSCTTDWILWLDADDNLTTDAQEHFAQAKIDLLSDDVDAVSMPYHYHFDASGRCTLTLYRERLIRRAAGHRWTGRVHEVLTVPAARVVDRTDLYVEHRPHPNKTERRVGRNLRILEAMVASGDQSSRTLLYYANELRDDGQYQAALVNYARYLDDPGAVWELYTARISMSRCARRLGRRDDALGHALAALALDPSRAEAPLAAGQIFFDEGDWTRAAPLFAAACAAVRPRDGFVANQDYTWRPWDFLGVCLANSGRHEDAIAAATRSVQRGNPDVKRVQANLSWSIEQLANRSD